MKVRGHLGKKLCLFRDYSCGERPSISGSSVHRDGVVVMVRRCFLDEEH